MLPTPESPASPSQLASPAPRRSPAIELLQLAGVVTLAGYLVTVFGLVLSAQLADYVESLGDTFMQIGVITGLLTPMLLMGLVLSALPRWAPDDRVVGSEGLAATGVVLGIVASLAAIVALLGLSFTVLVRMGDDETFEDLSAGDLVVALGMLAAAVAVVVVVAAGLFGGRSPKV